MCNFLAMLGKLEGNTERKDDLTSAHIHPAERLDPIQNHWVPLQVLSSPKMPAKCQKRWRCKMIWEMPKKIKSDQVNDKNG